MQASDWATRIDALIQRFADGNQAAFARRVGISKQAVQKLLGGSVPSGETIAAIHAAFPLASAEYLVTGRGTVEQKGTPPEPAGRTKVVRENGNHYGRRAEEDDFHARLDRIDALECDERVKILARDSLTAAYRWRAAEPEAQARLKAEEAAALRARAVLTAELAALRRGQLLTEPGFVVTEVSEEDAAMLDQLDREEEEMRRLAEERSKAAGHKQAS